MQIQSVAIDDCHLQVDDCCLYSHLVLDYFYSVFGCSYVYVSFMKKSGWLSISVMDDHIHL